MKVTKIKEGRYSAVLANGAEWGIVKNEGGRWIAFNENNSDEVWDGMRTKGEVVAALARMSAKVAA